MTAVRDASRLGVVFLQKQQNVI